MLDVGNALLICTALFSIGAAVSSWFALAGRGESSGRATRILNLAGFASITAALSLLTWMALDSDFTYHYVWAHSSASLEPVYRVSSIWAAGEGAMLLCTWCIGLVIAVETLLTGRRSALSPRFQHLFFAALSLLLFIFSVMVFSMGLFEKTNPSQLLSDPDGLGMDFLLRTPEMVVHAPVILGAYACLAALFAASLAHLITGEKHWTDTALLWGRLGWLLLTVGIAIGAIWAYYVIGWGGYWAWDPVETSSLLPWLMVTAFLHTQMRRSSGKEYPLASPVFGLLSFVGVVFVSFIVRAGGLWESSIHDYGSADASSAVSRLVSLLGEDASVAGTFAFMVLLLVVSAFVAVSAQRRLPRTEPLPKVSRLSELVNDRDNMFLAVALMSMTSLLALILLFKNTGSGQAGMYVEFTQKMSILFVALMVTMSLCLSWRLVGRERALWLAIGLVAVSVALATVSTILSWSDPLVVFSLPSYVVATASSFMRVVSAVRNGRLVGRLYKAGAQVAHLGISLVLVGFVVSSNLQTFPAQGYEAAMPVTGELFVGDFALRLLTLEVAEGPSGYPAEVAQVRTAWVEISRDGNVVDGEACLRILYGFDPVTGYYVLETVPYVRSSLAGDLYLSYVWMSDDIVLMRAKFVPLMISLWSGASLLCVGISIRLLGWRPGSTSDYPDRF